MYPVNSPTQLKGKIEMVGGVVKLYPINAAAPAISLSEFLSMWQSRNVTITIEENDRHYIEA